MIDIVKYQKILDEGLLLDHFFVLCSIRDNKEVLKNKRVQGFLNLLCKKAYIEDGVLTSKALSLIESDTIPIDIPLKSVEPIRVENEGKFDYARWIIRLHKECEAKLIKATGKRQVRADVKGKAYSFLPNSTDLGKVILRAVGAYKLKDFDRIEKCILRYVDICVKKDRWTPLLGYYVMKDNLSNMVTDMDNMDEEDLDLDSDKDTIVNI